MTTEHPSQTQLIAYGARTLNPDELLAVDRHLATCDACRDRLAGMLPKMTARPYDLSNDEEPFHLDYDQHLVPYVDGVADDIDREIIESHIALCPRCAEEVGDLQEFRQQSSQPARQTDRGVKTWVGWRDQRPQTWRRPLAAGLALVFSILGITAAVSFWDRSRTPQPKHVGSVPSPENDPKTVNSPASSPGQVATQPSPDRPDLQGEEPLITLYDAGGKILYYGNGDSKGLDALPPDLRATVENVLVTRRFGRSPALGNLYESNGRLRGGSEGQDTIVQLSPVGVILETDRPVFSWRALEGASEYVVTVHDSQLRQIENSGPVARTDWRIPKHLERGKTYSWQVRSVVNGKTVISPKPPAPETRFKVLDQTAFKTIQTAKRVFGRSHLTMAVLYWKHGLIDAAEREVEALSRANPGSAVVTDLLRSLKSPRS